MAKISIDGTEYDTDQLSDKAKSELNAVIYCDGEIQRLQMRVAALQTARGAYATALRGDLPMSFPTETLNFKM